MKSFSIIFSCLVFILLGDSVLSAGEKEFTVGVEEIEYYPHYDFPRKTTSFSKELLDLFASSHHLKFIYQPLPIKRLFFRFVSGKLDFKYPDHPGWRQDLKNGSKVIYSDPVVKIVGGTLVLPKNKGRGIESFKTLGIVLGFTPFHWDDVFRGHNITVFESSNVKTVLKQVLMERVDGVDMELSVAAYQLVQLGQPNGLVFDPTLPHIMTPYYLSTIKHPRIMAEFNEFLLVQAEEIERLKQRFGIRDAGTVLNLASHQ